jgi:hypothetical protein
MDEDSGGGAVVEPVNSTCLHGMRARAASGGSGTNIRARRGERTPMLTRGPAPRGDRRRRHTIAMRGIIPEPPTPIAEPNGQADASTCRRRRGDECVPGECDLEAQD